MTEEIEISIIIVTFNTFEMTCECIESIYAHTKTIHFEVILVDNCSTDASVGSFEARFPDIHYIRASENLGFAKGNNLGLQIAEGNFILLLNSDTLLHEDSVGTCVEKMRADPTIGALSPRLIYPNGIAQPVLNRFPGIRLELLEIFRLQKLMYPKKRSETFLGFFFDHNSEMTGDWIWGAFFVTRRSVVDQFPNREFQSDFFMYTEDLQWSYYIKKRLGMKIAFTAETSVVHYGSASSDQTPDIENTRRKLATNLRHLSEFYQQEKGYLFTFFLLLLQYVKYWTLPSETFQEPRRALIREIGHLVGLHPKGK